MMRYGGETVNLVPLRFLLRNGTDYNHGVDPKGTDTVARVGYARVSTIHQDTALQVAALAAAGCGVIREEKASGTTTDGRTELATVLAFLQKGDVLVVTRIDRLARSIGDLQTIVKSIKTKGASLECTEQPVNIGTAAAGKAFLDMLGVFAEFETNLRKERQLDRASYFPLL
jgi:DNA invertase Pin-like site-specific DNA recombinase